MRRLTILLVGSLLVAGMLVGGGVSTAQSADDNSNSSETHTLEIRATNGSNESITYSATASNNLSLENGENSDRTVRDRRVAGTVGGNDNKDVINYTGYIESFESQNNNIELRLNGRQISPKVLAGNHIEIIHPTNASGENVTYHYPIIGVAERGELADDNDTANGSIIQGSVDSGSDSFYFVGEIPESAFGEVAEIRINGQPAEKYLENPPPTSTATSPTPTTTTTVPDSPTTASTTVPPHQEQSTQPQGSESGSRSSDNTFLIGFIAGFILLIAGGIAGLFYLDRQ